jgi:hypothetical protein
LPRLLSADLGLWLVVADVSSKLYGGAAIDRGLTDLAWVAARAVAHDDVIEHFAQRFDVVPMKLFTIFKSDDRAVQHVSGNPDLPGIFRRIAGASEWSVRLQRSTIDEGRTMSDGRRRAIDEGRSTGSRSIRLESGAAFLRRKRSQRDLERAAAAEARGLANRVFGSLARVAREGVQKDTSMPGATVLLDAVFLVPRARTATFRAAVRRVARDAAAAGGDIALSGPWPPYHFVSGGRPARSSSGDA